MDITGKSAVNFVNFEHERSLNDKVDQANFQRVKGTWNIYFHGFMDERCDIAYVQKPTELQPGIYEITVYGDPAYLFLWAPKDNVGGMKGLITLVSDTGMTNDAYAKYKDHQSFI